MEHDANSRSQRVPWNQGKLIDQNPPLKLKEIRAIRICLQLTKKFVKLPCSTSPSTASCAAAIWAA